MQLNKLINNKPVKQAKEKKQKKAINPKSSSRNLSMVPAICTRCGAALDVDPSRDSAFCSYCGTQYSVREAIEQYNIQNAEIHTNSVHVHKQSGVDSVVGLVKERLDKRDQKQREKQLRKEEERIRREKQAEEDRKNAWKYILLMVVIMVVCLIIALIGELRGEKNADNIESSSITSYTNSTDKSESISTTEDTNDIVETVVADEVDQTVASEETTSPEDGVGESQIMTSFSKETAMNVIVVAFTNNGALDIFTGDEYDPEKFHDYSYRGEYRQTVTKEGEWSAIDENTWHVENMYLVMRNTDHATKLSCDVTYDGENYLVKSVNYITAASAYIDTEDPSKTSGWMTMEPSDFYPYLILSPSLIGEENGLSDANTSDTSRLPTKDAATDQMYGEGGWQEYAFTIFGNASVRPAIWVDISSF